MATYMVNLSANNSEIRSKRMQTKDMTTGSPAGLILRFALPLMLGNVFQQFYTFVDTMVVGQALGVKALAALGACLLYTSRCV